MQTTRGAPLSEAEPAPPRPAVARRRRATLLFAVAAVVVALDQVSKALAVHYLTGRSPVHVVGDLLRLVLLRNSGAAFSFAAGAGYTVVFSAIAVGVAVVVVRIAARLRSGPWAVGLGLLLGGAVGNLCDRVFRAPGVFRGWVVDFIELPHWPVFNLADAAITCAAVLIVVLAWRGVGVDGTPVQRRRDR